MTVNTPVHLGVDAAETGPQPIAVECPACFAIVRAARLDAHTKALHGTGSPAQ